MSQNADRRVLLGKVGAPHGVRGWVKIHSSTQPLDSILDYRTWQLGRGEHWNQFQVVQAQPQGKALIAQLADEHGNVLSDRDQAEMLKNLDIGVWRSEMPPLPKGEYYWADLIGLEVVTEAGESFGKVDSLMETGANNVLVIKGEQEILVPFVLDHVVKKVDLKKAVITVDWDPDY